MLRREIIETLEQGTPEWLSTRAGIATASEASPLLVKPRSKTERWSAGALTYAYKLVAERVIGGPVDTYQSPAMALGSEHEANLRSDYEFMTGQTVDEIGFVRVLCDGNPVAGYSPDGFVADDGLVEIKTRNPAKLISLHIGQSIDKSEYFQGQFELWATERSWIDHIAGYPGMPTHVRRYQRDEKMITEIETAVVDFAEYVKKMAEKIVL